MNCKAKIELVNPPIKILNGDESKSYNRIFETISTAKKYDETIVNDDFSQLKSICFGYFLAFEIEHHEFQILTTASKPKLKKEQLNLNKSSPKRMFNNMIRIREHSFYIHTKQVRINTNKSKSIYKTSSKEVDNKSTYDTKNESIEKLRDKEKVNLAGKASKRILEVINETYKLMLNKKENKENVNCINHDILLINSLQKVFNLDISPLDKFDYRTSDLRQFERSLLIRKYQLEKYNL